MQKKYLFLKCCLCFLMFFCVSLQAQQARSVSGVVVDEIGEPIIGAAVKIDGTTLGTITDMDGKFVISVPPKGKITISYIGYTSQTISDFKDMRIVLKEDLMKLDEVVVVGYGTQKMKNVTGAISTVTPTEISDLSVASLGNALGGVVNGLGVSGGNTRPGEGASLTIRQNDVASSFSTGGSSSPVYVIDDYIQDETAFNNLDASVIESITVLKDAAAAVYGARAAQGVILVKTKRGQIGTPKISYNGQFGYTDEVSRAKLLNAYDYGVLWNGVASAPTTDGSINNRTDLFQADELAAMRNLNYDLLKDEWSAAFTQKHSINVSGGTDRATYFAGMSYYTQDGNLGRLDYDRWNYRAGVDAKISKWLKASLQVSGDYGNQTKAYNKVGGENSDTDYNTLLTHLRYIPSSVAGHSMAALGVSNSEVKDIQAYNYRSIQDLNNYSNNRTSNMTLNSSVEYDFGWSSIFKGLKMKFSYSKSINNTKANQLGTNVTVYKMLNRGGSGQHLYTGDDLDLSEANFSAITKSNGNLIRRQMDRADQYQMNFNVSYARKFGLHDVSALFSIEKSEAESEYVWGQVLDPLSFNDGQSKTASGTQSTEFSRSESGMLSYIGRVNYSYADRYLLEFLIRSDASTKFAPENYWGVYPSLSLGWVVSEESWFKEHVKGIDFLKVRGSFGMLGKDNIAAWSWLTLYNRDANKGAVFGTSASNNIGAGISTNVNNGIPNRDAHWDKSYQTNLGFDIRTLDSRLSINLDGYYNMHRDMFMSPQGSAALPSTVGTKPAPTNYGSVDTYGVEISLGWKDNIGKDFKYWVKLNTGYSDNKVKKMYWPTTIAQDQQHPNERTDLGTWGYQCIGMFRSYQEIEEYFEKYMKKPDGTYGTYLGKTKDAVFPGMLIYKDIKGPLNSDGTYQAADHSVTDVDKVKISNRSNPYSFTLNFGGSWKGLSFSAQLGASWGGYSFVPKEARSVYSPITKQTDYKALEYYNMPSFWSNNMYVYENVYDAQGNIVAAQNRDAKYPNLMYSLNSETSTFWRISGTRVTLRNLTVAYSIPNEWLRKLGVGIESCRFNLTGQNLLSLYNPYPDNFMDPLTGNYGVYPVLRKFTLGVNISF